jgi:hypothetical protein
MSAGAEGHPRFNYQPPTTDRRLGGSIGLGVDPPQFSDRKGPDTLTVIRQPIVFREGAFLNDTSTTALQRLSNSPEAVDIGRREIHRDLESTIQIVLDLGAQHRPW